MRRTSLLTQYGTPARPLREISGAGGLAQGGLETDNILSGFAARPEAGMPRVSSLAYPHGHGPRNQPYRPIVQARRLDPYNVREHDEFRAMTEALLADSWRLSERGRRINPRTGQGFSFPSSAFGISRWRLAFAVRQNQNGEFEPIRTGYKGRYRDVVFEDALTRQVVRLVHERPLDRHDRHTLTVGWNETDTQLFQTARLFIYRAYGGQALGRHITVDYDLRFPLRNAIALLGVTDAHPEYVINGLAAIILSACLYGEDREFQTRTRYTGEIGQPAAINRPWSLETLYRTSGDVGDETLFRVAASEHVDALGLSRGFVEIDITHGSEGPFFLKAGALALWENLLLASRFPWLIAALESDHRDALSSPRAQPSPAGLIAETHIAAALNAGHFQAVDSWLKFFLTLPQPISSRFARELARLTRMHQARLPHTAVLQDRIRHNQPVV